MSKEKNPKPKEPKLPKDKPSNSPTPQDKRLLAEYLYMGGNLTQGRIAEVLGVSDSLVSKWAIAGNWKELSKTEKDTSHKIGIDINAQISKIFDDAKGEGRAVTSKEADIIVKLTNARQKIAKEYDLSVYVQIVQEITAFISPIAKPEILSTCIELLKAFTTQKAAEL